MPDVAVVGAGAAGLAAAIFAARRGRSVVALDTAKKLGAKILISGGGRCNVTNREVVPEDFRGGSRNTIRKILRAFSARATVKWFREFGIEFVEEDDGKLFPTTHRARTVLDALLAEAARAGVQLMTGTRVTSIERTGDGFRVGPVEAARVVVATGGLSLPKTGSDGTGYALVKALGHTIVPTAPALVALVLDGELHRPLAGITQPAEIAAGSETIRGSLLWTHYGISGPVALDASRHWHHGAALTLNLLPGVEERAFIEARGPKTVAGFLATRAPARVGEAILREQGVAAATRMDLLTRADRGRLVAALTRRALPVRNSRGYRYAEVTAGGVPLDEIDPRTMESRRCPGLHLVGEILDVDGRLGGFNFQWAWSTGFVAGAGV